MLARVMNILPILSLFLHGTALTANALPTLVVNAAPDAQVATLSLEGGPARADAPEIGFRADTTALQALATRRAAPNIIDRQSAYYRESRGFRKPEIILTLNHETAPASVHVFSLADDADLSTTLPVVDFLKNFDIKLRGRQDIYKCFDTATCVLESSIVATAHVLFDATVRVEDFEPIVSCGRREIVIERRLATPTVQRVKIRNDGLRRYLGLDSVVTGRGDPALNAAEFSGFAAGIAFFGEGGSAYREAHVFREYGGMKLKVDTLPHYFCHYTRVVSYPDHRTLAAQIGQSCQHLSADRWYVTGSSGGSDHPFSRDWFVPNCVDL
jgi:hypothetical protein